MIQIISPHIDDAFLSVGGNILLLIQKGIRFNIHYIFSVSSWTNPYANFRLANLNKDVVTSLRKQEEKMIQNSLKHNYEFWEHLDFPLRQTQNSSAETELLQDLENRFRMLVSKESLVLLPI